MFSWIRRRATYANVAMTLALVFAMSGGAYAAKKYLITSTKQISPKVLKALVGKAGPGGAQGSIGPAGAQGLAGAAGAKGETGTAGKDGAQGKEGPAGPAGAIGPAGAKGAAGAAGAAGATGPTGSPWTVGGTLPSGSTESGSWALPAGAGGQFTTASFPIPLAAAIDTSHAKFVPVGGTETKATGTGKLTSGENLVTAVSTTTGEFKAGYYIEGTGIKAGTLIRNVISATELELSQTAETSGSGVSLTAKSAPAECENTGHAGVANPENPEAGNGFFCVYAAIGTIESNALLFEKPGSGFPANSASTAGSLLFAAGEVTGGAFGYMGGTWAVTAP